MLTAGDEVGQSGLEYRYDERLRGTPGLAVRAVERGADGSVVEGEPQDPFGQLDALDDRVCDVRAFARDVARSQHPQDLAQLGERELRVGLDRGGGLGRLRAGEVVAVDERARVQRHERDPVREHVVHLARDPRPLGLPDPVGDQRLLALRGERLLVPVADPAGGLHS